MSSNLAPIANGPFGGEGGGVHLQPVQPITLPTRWSPPSFSPLYPNLFGSSPDQDMWHGVANTMFESAWYAAVAKAIQNWQQFDTAAFRSAYLALTDDQVELLYKVSEINQPDPLGAGMAAAFGVPLADYRPGGPEYQKAQLILATLQPHFTSTGSASHPPVSPTAVPVVPDSFTLAQRVASLEKQVAAFQSQIAALQAQLQS
ncbi:MAG: hypothetical protein U0Q18_37045 [Bryobacteraceae bacterium]